MISNPIVNTCGIGACVVTVQCARVQGVSMRACVSSNESQRNASTGKASHPWEGVISQRISKALMKYLPVTGDPALFAAVHAETCTRFRSMVESSLKDVDSALEEVVTLADLV